MYNLNSHFDVIVVGSGPAGSTSAADLASRGLKVLLIEKHSPPRYKTCGGGLVRRVTNLLPEKISFTFEKQFKGVQIFDHDAAFFHEVKRNYPVVAMTMRENFDFALLDYAKQNGAVVIDNCELTDIKQKKELVNLSTSKGDFTARFIIAADGAQSLVSKKAHFNLIKTNLPAVEYELFVNEKDFIRHSSSARFDFGIIPGGYAWVFPKKDHLSVGLGLLAIKSKNINLNSAIKLYLKKLNLNDIIKFERHGFIIPVSLKQNIISKGRILLTGDAAALADPLTAEGISSAVLSGQYAAEAIIEGDLKTDLVSEIYSRKTETIWKEIKAGLLLSRVFYEHRHIKNFLIKNYGVKFSELMTDVISGEKKYSELLKNPVNYFKLVKNYLLKPGNQKNLNPEYS